LRTPSGAIRGWPESVPATHMQLNNRTRTVDNLHIHFTYFFEEVLFVRAEFKYTLIKRVADPKWSKEAHSLGSVEFAVSIVGGELDERRSGHRACQLHG